MRGYFSIGSIHSKTEHNIGTLMRSAYNFGAAQIFTIGRRYKPQNSDTTQSWRHIPLYNYLNFDEFYNHIPYNCQLIAVELDTDAKPIKYFSHPERAIYLLGPEDGSIPRKILERCHCIIQLPGKFCMNVAAAGSCVMFDRINKSRS